MSVTDRILRGLRRVPQGFPADGRQLGLGLAAALDAQRARGAEPLDREVGDRGAAHAGHPEVGARGRSARATR